MKRIIARLAAPVILALTLDPSASFAQAKLPSGAAIEELWPGPSRGSYFGIARSGAKWYVLTPGGAAGPFDDAAPKSNSDGSPVYSLIASAGGSMFLVDARGESMGPYSALAERAAKGLPEGARTYFGTRPDGSIEAVFADAGGARPVCSAGDLDPDSFAVSEDGRSHAFAAERAAGKAKDAVAGFAWDSAFIPDPLAYGVIGIAFGGEALIAAETDGREVRIVAFAKGAGGKALEAMSGKPAFRKQATLADEVLPPPEGVSRYVLDGIPAAYMDIVPMTRLPAPQEFAVRFGNRNKAWIMTARGFFEASMETEASDAPPFVSPDGEIVFTSGKIGRQSISKGGLSWGSYLGVASPSFIPGDDGLYFIATAAKGDRVLRDGEIASETGETIRFVRARDAKGASAGLRSELPFDGLYSLQADDMSTRVMRIGAPGSPAALVAGPYEGNSRIAAFRSGGRELVAFLPLLGSGKLLAGRDEIAISGSIAGDLIPSPDLSSFAFREDRGKAGIVVRRGDKTYGPYKAVGAPAFILGSEALCYVFSKGGLYLASGDAKPAALKGSRFDPARPPAIVASADGKILSLRGSIEAPGSRSKEPVLAQREELWIDGAVRVGYLRPEEGIAAYWDAKSGQVVVAEIAR